MNNNVSNKHDIEILDCPYCGPIKIISRYRKENDRRKFTCGQRTLVRIAMCLHHTVTTRGPKEELIKEWNEWAILERTK